MEQQQQQPRRMVAPPIAQLLDRLQKAEGASNTEVRSEDEAQYLKERHSNYDKYTPTHQELQAFIKCRNDVVVTCVTYPLFFGTLAWTVSYRLKLLMRGFNTGVAAALGLAGAAFPMEAACLKHFCALKGSPLREELIDMYNLQKDFPNHPLLKDILPQERELDYGDGQDVPVPRSPLGILGLATEESREGPNPSGGDSAASKERDRQSQSSEPVDKPKSLVNKDRLGTVRPISRGDLSGAKDKSEALMDATDILVDPFNMSVWMETDGSLHNHREPENAKTKEMRRSRMTARERREHMRSLYVQRQERVQN